MAEIDAVTDATFAAEVLGSDVPVLVDFWAEWCAPCKAIAPHVATLAGEHAGQLKVVKLDIQSNMKTPMSYRVSSIPTLVLFKGGAEIDRQQGAQGGLDGLRRLVGRHLSR